MATGPPSRPARSPGPRPGLDPRLLPLSALLVYGFAMVAPRHPLWGAAGILCGAGLGLRRFRTLRYRALALTGLILLAAAGWRAAPRPPGTSLPMGTPLRIQGVVLEDPRRGTGGITALVSVGAVAPPGPGPWRAARGRVLVGIRAEPPPPLARGDTVVLRSRLKPPLAFRNPGSEGYAGYLRRRAIAARATCRWPGEILVLPPGPGSGPLLRGRRQVSRRIAAAAPGPGGAVLRAMTVGDRSGLGPLVRDTLRRTGTAHLVAISGLHLAIVGLLVVPVARTALLAAGRGLALAVPIDPWARGATLPVLAAYAALSGWQVSALRALVMVGLLLVAGGLSRPVSPLSVLAATALVLGIVSPTTLLDPGLHLSLAALAGLFWLGPGLETLLRRPPDPLDRLAPAPGALGRLAGRAASALRSAACASAGAAIATFPVSAFHFGGAPLLGLVTNTLSIPLVAYGCLPLGLAGVVLSPFLPGAAEGLWAVAGAGLGAWLRALEGVPAPVLRVPAAATPVGLAGAFVVVAAVGCAVRRPREPLRPLALGAAGGLLLLGAGLAPGVLARADPRVHLWVLDVGQGQSLALRLPPGRWVAVDGGGFPGSPFDVGDRVVRPALEALGARGLWLAVSTHPHPDHAGGLPSLIRWGRPEAVWLPEAFRGDPRYRGILESARQVGARAVWVGPGRGLRGPGWALTTAQVDGPTENDRSLVLRVEAWGRAMVLPADLERPGQEMMVGQGLPGRAPILVAPHHGAADALFPPFLRAVAPRAVLISASGRPGLPARVFEDACRAEGAVVLSTHRLGCLHGWVGPSGWGVDAFVDRSEGI